MAGFYWHHWQVGDAFPANAIGGGFDSDGVCVYVGRAQHEGDLIPAKVIPDKRACYVAFGGCEVSLQACEILCQPKFVWESSCNGTVPAGAIPVGQTACGEPLYAGRVLHEGSHTVGKVHPSHGTCYIPYGGEEIANTSYEVLVLSNY